MKNLEEILIEKINADNHKKSRILGFYKENVELAKKENWYDTDFIEREDNEIVSFYAENMALYINSLEQTHKKYPNMAILCGCGKCQNITLAEMIENSKNLQDNGMEDFELYLQGMNEFKRPPKRKSFIKRIKTMFNF